jgi:hypothetical protein
MGKKSSGKYHVFGTFEIEFDRIYADNEEEAEDKVLGLVQAALRSLSTKVTMESCEVTE